MMPIGMTKDSKMKDEVIFAFAFNVSIYASHTRLITVKGAGLADTMAVQYSEVDFDDPTYMRIADVVSPSSEPTAMKKRGTIYSELDESWSPRDRSGSDHLAASRTGGGAGEVTAGGGASEATKQEELVCCSQIDLGVDTDSDSEGEVAVTGPQVIRQEHRLTAVLSGEDADAAIPITPQRRVVSMALSEDIYRSSSFLDSLSPDFRIIPYPPAMFGKDGFAPVSCGDNPFDPSSKTILKARDRDELEESLRDFADSLIRSEPPPMYCKLDHVWCHVPACT